MAGYGSAFGYSAAQASRPGQYSVLADWLVAHGLRYGLGGGPTANVVTVDGGGRVAVEPTEVRMGRVGALLYQSSAAAFDVRRHDANFLVTQMPAVGPAYPAATDALPVVLATFGRPGAGPYLIRRVHGALVWNVNLLTRLRALGAAGDLRAGSVSRLTPWNRPLMRHPETNWNKFVGIACAPALSCLNRRGLPGCASRTRSRTRQRGR